MTTTAVDNPVDVMPAAMVDALAGQLYQEDRAGEPDGGEWLEWHDLPDTLHATYRRFATRLLSAAFATGDVTQQWAIGYPDSAGTAILGDGWWTSPTMPMAMLGYPNDLPAGSHLVRRVVVSVTEVA